MADSILARARVFVAMFVILFAVQGSLAWWLYRASRGSLDAVLEAESRRVVESTVQAIEAAGDDQATRAQALRQVRDAERLAQALVVDVDGRIQADAAGAPAGTPASALAVSPALLKRALADGVAQESSSLDDEPVRRAYARTADGRSVICIDRSDSLPEVAAALRRPAAIALVVSLGSALALAAAAVAAARSLERAGTRAHRAERLAIVGSLAATIAHEVKNPMGIILSSTQVLIGSAGLTADQRALLADIDEEVRRADDQLNAFLDLARDMPIRTAPLDLADLTRGTVELMGARARSAGVDLSFAATGPVAISGDRRRLRQALVNLVLNAIEASPSGALVSVSVEGDPSAGLARVHIRDQGAGIAPAVRARLFEPFVTTKAEGTGLGLGAAKRVIERHGGDLTLASAIAGGTIATIELPLSRGDADARAGRR